MANWETVQENYGQPAIKKLALGKNVDVELVHIANLDEWYMQITIRTASMKRFDVSRKTDLDPADGPGDWEQMQSVAEGVAAFWLEELSGLSAGAAALLRKDD